MHRPLGQSVAVTGMARFETRGQVASLFLGAGCVGILLILLLTAEARHREGQEEAGAVREGQEEAGAVREGREEAGAEAGREGRAGSQAGDGDMLPLVGVREAWLNLRSSLW